MTAVELNEVWMYFFWIVCLSWGGNRKKIHIFDDKKYWWGENWMIRCLYKPKTDSCTPTLHVTLRQIEVRLNLRLCLNGLLDLLAWICSNCVLNTWNISLFMCFLNSRILSGWRSLSTLETEVVALLHFQVKSSMMFYFLKIMSWLIC